MNNRINTTGRFRLAFIDLDDTLLGPDKTISAANLSALARLRQAGVQIAVASGRHHRNIAAMERLGPQHWILSAHGSVVRHRDTNEALLEMTMDPALVAEVCRRGVEMAMSVIVYHRDGVFVEEETDWTRFYAKQVGQDPVCAGFYTLAPDGFQKVLWSDHPDRIHRIAPELQAEFAGRLGVLETNPELLEFFAPSANKAIGAQTLAGKLSVAPEETLAFGDGNNDVELLRWAGLSVAMDHGRESARRAAKLVSPPGPPDTAFARGVDLALSE